MNKFLYEIHEQPAAISNLLSFYSGPPGENLLYRVKDIIENNKIEQIIFTGMGSSYFISHAASELFNKNNLHSFVINTGELLHYNMKLFDRGTLLVCISQSGESFEIVEILTKLNSKVHCIGIVNDEQSTLDRKAGVSLQCKAGREEKTSTKTFIASSLVSFILGWYLSGSWNNQKVRMIEQLAMKIKEVLENYVPSIGGLLSFLGDLDTIQIIARGPSFSSASQSALMFREALHIPATGILGGEFRHGPMEMVSEGFKAILFASPGKTFAQSTKMARDIAGFGGKVMLITGEKPEIKVDRIMPVVIDETDEFLFSLLGIVPVQLLIDSYAKARAFEAGNFNRGAKVTKSE